MNEAFEDFMKKVINPATVVIRGKYKISRPLATAISEGFIGKVLPYKQLTDGANTCVDIVVVTSARVFNGLMGTTFVEGNTVLATVLNPIFKTIKSALEQKPIRCGIVGNYEMMLPIFAGHITHGMLNQFTNVTFEEDVLAIGIRLNITVGKLAVTVNSIEPLDEADVIPIVNQIS